MENRRYIHNFWKLGGAASIYDSNRAVGALRNHTGKRAPLGFATEKRLMGKGERGIGKKAQLVAKYSAIWSPRRSAKSRHPVRAGSSQ